VLALGAAIAVTASAAFAMPGPGLLADEPPDPSCTNTWDGGAGTSAWAAAQNWEGDALPGPGDVACIPAATTVVHGSGTHSVGALLSFGTLQLSGGVLGLAGASTAADLEQSGGELTGDGDLSADGLAWSGGSMSGTGTTVLTSGSLSSIDSTGSRTTATSPGRPATS
jgi:hypothetical protein